MQDVLSRMPMKFSDSTGFNGHVRSRDGRGDLELGRVDGLDRSPTQWRDRILR